MAKTKRASEPQDQPEAVAQPSDEPRVKPFERRFYKLSAKPEIRSQGSQRTLEGHAAVFNVRTTLRDGLEEQIARGCFTDTIGRDDVRGLYNHDMNMVLARSRPGETSTMDLSEDSSGLAFRMRLGNQSYALNLAESIDRGDVDQCSFGFQPEDDTFDRSVGADGKTTYVRTLRKCTLYDVGPVTFAQYPEAKVAARSLLRLDDIPIAEILEARARLESGADDPAAAALIRRAMRALATVAGPTPQERMKSMQQRMALAQRAV